MIARQFCMLAFALVFLAGYPTAQASPLPGLNAAGVSATDLTTLTGRGDDDDDDGAKRGSKPKASDDDDDDDGRKGARKSGDNDDDDDDGKSRRGERGRGDDQGRGR